LITANITVEQGKEVFAIPEDITRKTSKGTNRLIQDSAYPVLEAADVFEVQNLRTLGRKERVEPANFLEDKSQIALVELLKDEPAHIDVLYQRTDLTIQEIQAALSMLELHGSIKHLGGMHYLRICEEPIRYCVD
jgi:DNA processing protein